MPLDNALLYSSLAENPCLGEIVDQFVDAMPERVAELRARFAAEDWEGLRRCAHQLKGAAGSYGFGVISVSAARLEDAIRHAQSDQIVAAAVEELSDLCGRARSGGPRRR